MAEKKKTKTFNTIHCGELEAELDKLDHFQLTCVIHYCSNKLFENLNELLGDDKY